MGTVVKMAPAAVQPITIGAFTLTENGLEVDTSRAPTFSEYVGVGDFIRRAHKASAWWLADWILYGDSRPEWKERIDAEMGIDQLEASTVRDYRYVAKKFPPSSRLESVSFEHHHVVAGLEPEDRSEWLERAASEGWSKHELRGKLKAWRNEKTISGQAPEMHDVEVSVVLTVEASSSFAAEGAAWELVKGVLEQAGVGKKIRVIAAHARTR